jgi:hypothetical protein
MAAANTRLSLEAIVAKKISEEGLKVALTIDTSPSYADEVSEC